MGRSPSFLSHLSRPSGLARILSPACVVYQVCALSQEYAPCAVIRVTKADKLEPKSSVPQAEETAE